MSTLLSVLSTLNYILALFYGTALSVMFAGGCNARSEQKKVLILCLVLLFIQAVSFFALGLDATKKIYPLITHLPLILMLIKILHRPFVVVLASVMTGYFCCQLPRWFGAFALFIFDSELACEISYLLCIFPFYLLLRHYLANTLYQAMTYSRRTLFLFSILPISYYAFNYATTVYTSILYTSIHMISEFLPTIMVLFYTFFISLYHSEMQTKNQLELDNIMLAAQSQQAQKEIANLRHAQQQTVSYRHDLRHHINFIRSSLAAGQIDKTLEYLTQVQKDIESITPLHFCENETANLLFSSFYEKAKQNNIPLSIQADLPQELHISDTELCSVLSNALENAIHACTQIVTVEERFIKLRMYKKNNKLCLDIRNSCHTEPVFKNGIPVSSKIGHGIGVRSMIHVIEKYQGVFQFSAKDGVFMFQASL